MEITPRDRRAGLIRQPPTRRIARGDPSQQTLRPAVVKCGLGSIARLGLGDTSVFKVATLDPDALDTSTTQEPQPVVDQPTKLPSSQLKLDVPQMQVGPFIKPVWSSEITITDERWRQASVKTAKRPEGDINQPLPGPDGAIARLMVEAYKEARRIQLKAAGESALAFGNRVRSGGATWWDVDPSSAPLPNGDSGPPLKQENWWRPWQDVLPSITKSSAPSSWNQYGSYKDLVETAGFPPKQLRTRKGDPTGATRPGRCWRGLCVPSDQTWFLTVYTAHPRYPVYRYKDPNTGDRMGVYLYRQADRTTFLFKKAPPPTTGVLQKIWNFIKEVASEIFNFVADLLRNLARALLCSKARPTLKHLAEVADGKVAMRADVKSQLQSAGVSSSTIAAFGGAKAAIGAAAAQAIADRLEEHLCPPPPPSDDTTDKKPGLLVPIALSVGVAAGGFFLLR